MNQKLADLQAELDIWNRCYWFLNRPVWPVETKGMAEMSDKVPDTIPARPETKREKENA